MKKIFYIYILSIIFSTTSAFAICSIEGGFCSASAITPQTIEDKYIPNKLDNLKKPDVFQPPLREPYNPTLIKVDTYHEKTPENTIPSYNTSCQFGVCLPGENQTDTSFK